ncbi:hypothetical protein AL037_18035 [Salipiger aestuarii]|nr:hypothetical protein AL037_18035 [Salipiger aestuarii]
MATLVLGAAGAAIGGSIGGAILGVSVATIGSTIGSVVDSWIILSLAPTQRIEGARLDTLRITSATEGAVIPRLHGRMRIGGNIVWATDFREETKTTTQDGGGGGKVKTTEYLYYASFAVALCEGPITSIGRIWADGKPMDLSGATWRWYPGDETQTADPFIAARMGAASTPAYRGTAYVVSEELALSIYVALVVAAQHPILPRLLGQDRTHARASHRAVHVVDHHHGIALHQDRHEALALLLPVPVARLVQHGCGAAHRQQSHCVGQQALSGPKVGAVKPCIGAVRRDLRHTAVSIADMGYNSATKNVLYRVPQRLATQTIAGNGRALAQSGGSAPGAFAPDSELECQSPTCRRSL